MMIDLNALLKLTYGLYVAGVENGGRFGGCVVDAVMQMTDDTLAICCNKKTQTREFIAESGRFSLSVLSNKTDPFVIGNFGFQSGRDVNKWAKVPHRVENGLPVLNGAAAYLFCRVAETKDLGSHTLFLCAIEAAENGQGEALSYTLYRKEWKERVAAAFKAEKPIQDTKGKAMTKWVCTVCGYEYEGDTLPADYTCPVCGVGADQFEKVEDKAAKTKEETPEKRVCSVCGHVYDGETPFDELPDDYTCPVCHHPKSAFVKK